jgi:DNA-binding CsgD family transcriptional regulator
VRPGRVPAQILDQLSYGLVVVDARARIVSTNAAGERQLQLGEPLSASRGTAACPRARSAWNACLRKSTAASPRPTLLLVPRDHAAAWQLVAMPVAAGLVAVWIVDSEASIAPLLLREYRLTAAEIRVANYMLRGGRLVEIARRLGVSDNTVRTHAKRMYAKLGVEREVELVRLLVPLLALNLNGRSSPAG